MTYINLTDYGVRFIRRYTLNFEPNKIYNAMSKEKSGSTRQDKKAPAKTLKEKRVAKEAKRKEKRESE